MARSDWDIQEGLDPDGPSAADLDRFGDEMVTCPSCCKKFYDQAELCPHCGHAMEAPQKKLPLGVLAIVVLMIVLMLFWLL